MNGRVLNATGGQSCGYCDDTGFVVVAQRPLPAFFWRGERRQPAGEVEEAGPCPRCELGERVEFPPQSAPPWGPEGFWRGRSTADVRPLLRVA